MHNTMKRVQDSKHTQPFTLTQRDDKRVLCRTTSSTGFRKILCSVSAINALAILMMESPPFEFVALLFVVYFDIVNNF